MANGTKTKQRNKDKQIMRQNKGTCLQAKTCLSLHVSQVTETTPLTVIHVRGISCQSNPSRFWLFFFKPGVGGENQSEIETQSSEGKKREWMRRR